MAHTYVNETNAAIIVISTDFAPCIMYQAYEITNSDDGVIIEIDGELYSDIAHRAPADLPTIEARIAHYEAVKQEAYAIILAAYPHLKTTPHKLIDGTVITTGETA